MALEREAFGSDHAEAGAWLMQQWGLPDYLPLAARGSQLPAASQAPADLQQFVGCVAASGPVADYALDPQESVLTALGRNAVTRLDMDDDAVVAVVERLAETIPEIESLFEFSILEPHQAAALNDQAREVLATRNLQLLQEPTEYRRDAAEYKRLHSELQGTGRPQSTHRAVQPRPSGRLPGGGIPACSGRRLVPVHRFSGSQPFQGHQ